MTFCLSLLVNSAEKLVPVVRWGSMCHLLSENSQGKEDFDEGLDDVRDLNRTCGGRMPRIDQGCVSNSSGAKSYVSRGNFNRQRWLAWIFFWG